VLIFAALPRLPAASRERDPEGRVPAPRRPQRCTYLRLSRTERRLALTYRRRFSLELKAEGGRLSGAQSEALEAMRTAGADVGVAYGLDAALCWLTERGILRGWVG
jgi:hypothetical protein